MIRGGRSYVFSPPSFSNDAKRLLVCSANSVSIFSTATGLQLTSLEGHTALVTTIVVVPASTPAAKVLCYCWTASLDGTIRYWDFSAPEPIKVIDIKFPVYSMVIPFLSEPSQQPADSKGKSSKVFAYVSIKVEDSNQPKAVQGQIRKCNLTDSCLAGGTNLAETQWPEFVTLSPSRKYFGIRVKRKLHIWKVPAVDSKGAAVKRITLHHTKSLSVLAFHPTQRIVAAGDVTGRILIWRGFGNRAFAVGDGLVSERGQRATDNEDERPGVRGDDDADSCSVLHWHPAKVSTLHFSSDGAYLYSGGKEGVLVVWQLDTGKKKFLPRIGSPLSWFKDSPDPTLSSISCADNQIHLLKMPSMEILKSISGIKLPCSIPQMSKGLQSGVAFGHNAGLVALCTENYCIQLYNLFDDRGISEVQVCERNHQPGDELTMAVTLAVLSLDGSMMSTAEVKLAEEGLGKLVCLKFWSSGLKGKEFSLSTIIYEPHRDAGISAITFHPTKRMAVSSSYGGDFKVWVCHNAINLTDEMPPDCGWTCHAVGSYKKKPMTAATFSTDGSVLAVAAETVITLWDAERNILLAVTGETLTPIVNLSFVGRSEYLVSASWGSKPQLAVWSMSKLSLSWSYVFHVEAVASAAVLSHFAVLVLLPEPSNSNENTQLEGIDGIILLFNAENPSPVATWSVRKAKGGALAFLQVNQLSAEESMTDERTNETMLAYLNGDHEYVLFDPYGNNAKERNLIQHQGLSDLEESGRFGYASIYGELPEFGPEKKHTSWVPSAPSERPWQTIFSGSSHNLPPLTKLCSAFLESLLEKRTTVAE